jgi:SAM-dependent methyltransferase
MDEATRSALAELNHAFYARFAGDFARTRRGWPRGFERILPHLRPAANVLDVGCGNGRLLAFLAEYDWRGHYLGVDGSPGLLAAAEQSIGCTSARTGTTEDRDAASSPAPSSAPTETLFRYADLLSPEWTAAIGGFVPDTIACLAVLHHIPGAQHRARLVTECARLLAPSGTLIVSVWQFMSAPRLQTRILPWSAAGLRAEDVDPGDYLLAWGERAAGHRYCAAIDKETLCSLTTRAGLATVETFYADGHEGNLSLYGIFRSIAT